MRITSFTPISYRFLNLTVNMLEAPSKDCIEEKKLTTLFAAKHEPQEG